MPSMQVALLLATGIGASNDGNLRTIASLAADLLCRGCPWAQKNADGFRHQRHEFSPVMNGNYFAEAWKVTVR
jgi:hypothetical protein